MSYHCGDSYKGKIINCIRLINSQCLYTYEELERNGSFSKQEFSFTVKADYPVDKTIKFYITHRFAGGGYSVSLSPEKREGQYYLPYIWNYDSGRMYTLEESFKEYQVFLDHTLPTLNRQAAGSKYLYSIVEYGRDDIMYESSVEEAYLQNQGR